MVLKFYEMDPGTVDIFWPLKCLLFRHVFNLGVLYSDPACTCHLQHTLSNPWRGDLHQESRWAGPCSGPPSRWRTATAWMSTAPRTVPNYPRCSGTSCVAGCAGLRQRLGPEREAWPLMGCDWRWRRARPCCPPPARNIRAEFRDSERKK